MKDWTSIANEVSRTETSKVYELDAKAGQGQYGIEAYPGPIHFQADGKSGIWVPIDTAATTPVAVGNLHDQMLFPVTVYDKDVGYEITSRADPSILASVKLRAVDGVPFDPVNRASLSFVPSVSVHPNGARLWKEFAKPRASDLTLEWEVKMLGGTDSPYPLIFRDSPEAYSVGRYEAMRDPFASFKYAVQVKTERIDETKNGFIWREVIPGEAMCVDTDFQVAATGDDGRVSPEYLGGFFANADTLSVGYAASSNFHIFWRVAVAIPKYAYINTATLSYYSNNCADPGNTVASRIYTEAADNPGAIVSVADFSSRTLSTGYVDWSFTNTNTSDVLFTSPSVAPLVRTRVGSSGWVSGNYIQFLHKNNAGSYFQNFWDYTQSTTHCPKLSATWSTASQNLLKGMTHPSLLGRLAF